ALLLPALLLPALLLPALLLPALLLPALLLPALLAPALLLPALLAPALLALLAAPVNATPAAPPEADVVAPLPSFTSLAEFWGAITRCAGTMVPTVSLLPGGKSTAMEITTTAATATAPPSNSLRLPKEPR